MSERYGTPGELQEVLEGLEDYVREQIDESVGEMKRINVNIDYDVRYVAGRASAFRDVLDYLGVSHV